MVVINENNVFVFQEYDKAEETDRRLKRLHGREKIDV